jgi:hypothetical protein
MPSGSAPVRPARTATAAGAGSRTAAAEASVGTGAGSAGPGAVGTSIAGASAHGVTTRPTTQHQLAVAVRLAVQRSPSDAAQLGATHEHAARVVAHQRHRPCDPGPRQVERRRAVRQPPEACGDRVAVGGQVRELDVEPVRPKQAHQDGGEVGVGARDREPAQIAVGQHGVEVGAVGPRGHGDRADPVAGMPAG